MATAPRPLDYRGPPVDPRAPDEPPEVPPSRLVAILLCLPGAFCWFVLLLMIVGAHGIPAVMPTFLLDPPILLPVWLIALVTAIISFCHYDPRQTLRYRHVLINVIVNAATLLFTLLCLIAGVVFDHL